MLKRFRELRRMVARAIGPDRQCRVGRHCRKRILPSRHLSLLIEKKNLAEEFAPSLAAERGLLFTRLESANLYLAVNSFVCTGIHAAPY